MRRGKNEEGGQLEVIGCEMNTAKARRIEYESGMALDTNHSLGKLKRSLMSTLWSSFASRSEMGDRRGRDLTSERE